jgi:beta-ureidopropionase
MQRKIIAAALLLTSMAHPSRAEEDSVLANKRNTVTVAAVQLTGYDKKFLPKPDYNPAEAIVAYAERAARDGAELVVFPEYHLGQIHVPGPETEQIGAAAAKHRLYVIVGCWQLFPDGSFANAALLFGRDGRIMGKYYKTHAAVDSYDDSAPPYSKPPGGHDEEWFVKNDPEWLMKPGDELPVFDLDFARIGIMTCYDGYFPETARVLSLKGAEIIIWINGRYGSVQDFVVKTVMMQESVSMICTNQAYGCGTMIAQWPETILALCPEPKEDYITATLDLAAVRKARKNSRDFQQRRPDLYGPLTRSHDIWCLYAGDASAR